MSYLIKKTNEEEKVEIEKEDNGYINFLLEEYRYFSDWFKRSEETGEKRLNFFITLVTAIIAVIMTFITSTTEFPEILSIYTPIIISLLLSLLVLGILTFGRIIKRNKASDGYKKDIDRIRLFFKNKYKKNLHDYEFFHEIKGRKILTGGVADVIISLNSILFVITVLFLTFAFTLLLRIFLFILSFFGIFFFSQYIALIQYYKNYVDLMRIDRPSKLLLRNHIVGFSLSGLFLVLIGLFTFLWFFYKENLNISKFFEYFMIISSCLSILIWVIGFWNLRSRYYILTKRKKQVDKNWEWRIFFQIDKFDLWEVLIKNEEKDELLINSESIIKFQDNYFDLQKAEFGLKERWMQRNGEDFPKLELKIQIEADNNVKAELWAKIISKEIKKSLNQKVGLKKNQLMRLLQKRLNKSSPDDSTYIEKVLIPLNKSELKKTSINKDRKRIRGKYNKKHNKWEFYHGNDRKKAPLENSKVIFIEQTDIKFYQTGNQELRRVRSICLEAKKGVKIIEKFIDKFIKFKEYHSVSYPEFIKNPNRYI